MREENARVEEDLQQNEAVPETETPEVPDQTPPEECPSETEDSLPEAPPAAAEESETEAEAAAAEEAEPPETEPKPVPYSARYSLKYREGKRSTALDLAGTRAFLLDAGFDGGELRRAREGKSCAQQIRDAENSKSSRLRCSYCGAEISGVEFYRLPDGRMRCTTCSSTVVKTKAEVEALCRRVITNMDQFFGATLGVPVSIEVTEERKLKKRIGVPLGTRDSQSVLILGVAVNRKNRYSIILENGAPRISLIATFAHELTHIWQYTHWDNNQSFPKCAPGKRLLIYEGMAKWVEIQYLYLIGETDVAQREETITRNRQDEYGIGFRLYEDRYPLTRDAILCEETPFTPNQYPL